VTHTKTHGWKAGWNPGMEKGCWLAPSPWLGWTPPPGGRGVSASKKPPPPETIEPPVKELAAEEGSSGESFSMDRVGCHMSPVPIRKPHVKGFRNSGERGSVVPRIIRMTTPRIDFLPLSFARGRATRGCGRLRKRLGVGLWLIMVLRENTPPAFVGNDDRERGKRRHADLHAHTCRAGISTENQ